MLSNGPLRSAALAAVFLALGAAATADAATPGAHPVLKPADFSLADYAGKVLVVDFWASWCKPCGKALPWLSQLASAHRTDGLVVVAVNLDEDLDSARAMLAELSPAVAVVHDPEGELAGRYDLQGMPSTFVYDRAGKLRFDHVGYVPAEAGDREAEIALLLKEKEGDRAP